MRKPLRHFILFLFSLSVVCSLALPTYAHPGKTDSGGGHYNRSTGEYHYHHGQSAHDHYDMDGDGVIDCPYDFADEANSDSGTGRKTETKSIPSTETDDIHKNRLHKPSFFDWASALATSIFPSLALSFFIIYLLSFPAQFLISERILEKCIWPSFWLIFVFVYIKMVGWILI